MERVNDIEEADRRDYANFDRLDAFKKNYDKIQDVVQRTKKLDTIKSLVKDVPANSG